MLCIKAGGLMQTPIQRAIKIRIMNVTTSRSRKNLKDIIPLSTRREDSILSTGSPCAKMMPVTRYPQALKTPSSDLSPPQPTTSTPISNTERPTTHHTNTPGPLHSSTPTQRYRPYQVHNYLLLLQGISSHLHLESIGNTENYNVYIVHQTTDQIAKDSYQYDLYTFLSLLVHEKN